MAGCLSFTGPDSCGEDTGTWHPECVHGLDEFVECEHLGSSRASRNVLSINQCPMMTIIAKLTRLCGPQLLCRYNGYQYSMEWYFMQMLRDFCPLPCVSVLSVMFCHSKLARRAASTWPNHLTRRVHASPSCRFAHAVRVTRLLSCQGRIHLLPAVCVTALLCTPAKLQLHALAGP